MTTKETGFETNEKIFIIGLFIFLNLSMVSCSVERVLIEEIRANKLGVIAKNKLPRVEEVPFPHEILPERE